MNIHLPQSIQARNELKRIANVKYQIVGVKDSSPIIGCQQDTLSGAYMLTEPSVKLMGWEVANILCNTTSDTKFDIDMNKEYTGHEIFSHIIPSGINNVNKNIEIRDGKLIKGYLDKSSLSFAKNSIIHFVWDKWGPDKTRRFIDDSQRLVLNYLLTRGQTVSFGDILLEKETNQKVQQIIENAILQSKYDITQFENDAQEGSDNIPVDIIEGRISSDLAIVQSNVGMMLMQHFNINNFFWAAAKSGAKGNASNVSQINGVLGQNNVEGTRIKKKVEGRSLVYFHKDDDTPEARGFIKNSYLSGLKGFECCYNAMASREGLIDTAIKSVTRETPLIIIENGQSKYVKIGDWIDNKLDNPDNKDKVENHQDRNLEIMDVDNIYIPTVDDKGKVTWGTVTAVTRHDPGNQLYEIKTYSGRKVTVTESQSLLIWNNETKEIREKLTPLVKIGDQVPITCVLPQSPIINNYINMVKYFSKNEYIYGTDYNKAIEMMNASMLGKNKIPSKWWENNNNNTFTLPYTSKARLQRASIRSKQIKDNYIYPYSANREDILIPDKFELNNDNGIFIGLFLADGNTDKNSVRITKQDINIKTFVKKWFDNHNINWNEDNKINDVGTTETVRGNSSILATFLNKLVNKGSHNKHLPDESFTAPDEFIIGLLNGYFSGDGCITKNSIEVSSVSYRLIEGINMLLSRLGIFGKITKIQHKKNNFNTQNIKPVYNLRISAQWAKMFSTKITLLEENKNKKLKEHNWIDNHMIFETFNDVVLDKIIEINIIDTKEHPKVYDLTIPETFNFCIANGLGCRDTASTGYIQRQLIKGLEDLMINYDGTNRNARGIVVQMIYGENGINQSIQTDIQLNILEMDNKTLEDKLGFSKEQMKKIAKGLKLSEKSLDEFNEKYIKKMKRFRDEFRRIQFSSTLNYKVLEDKFMLPVNLFRITQFYSTKKENIELSPMDIEDEINKFLEDYDNRLITLLKPTDKFMKQDDRELKFLLEIALNEYLAPVKCIFEYGLTKKSFKETMDEIRSSFIKAIIEPGEMVGILAAQSIGEPTSQMTLNTKHFAGASKKTNTTSGVARIQELFHYSKNIKTPQMIVYFQEPYDTNETALNRIVSNFKYLNIRQLYSSAEVYYDIGTNDINGKKLKNDKVSMPFFVNNQKVEISTLPFVFRIKINIEKMLEKETSLLDIKTKFISYWYKNYTNIKNLKKSDKEIISRVSRCAILSNLPTDEEQILHIRFNMSAFNYNIITDFLKMILDDITLKGIENISNVDVVQERRIKFDNKSGEVIDIKENVVYTSGINFDSLKMIKGIDFSRTRCNNIDTILKMYGIEATRQILLYELKTTYSEGGSNINVNHLSLLVDQMCHMGEITAMDRHGLAKIDIDPIARASFEKTMDHFINAAVFNEKDTLSSVSSRIALGKVIHGGTGAFELLLDTKKIKNSEYTENETGGRITFTPLEEELLLVDIVKNDTVNKHFFNPHLGGQ